MEREHRSLILALKARQRAAGEQASGARYGLFAAFRGGMQTLVDALTRELGERIHTRTLVTSVERDKLGWAVEIRGSFQPYDAVIVALPAHIAGQILDGFDRPLAAELFAIDYGSAATVTFAWPRAAIARPLDAYGFVVPAIEQRGIIASTWASVKYEGRAPADKALIRAFIGGHTGQHLLEQTDPQLVELARRELEALMGVRAAPDWSRVVRYERAMPQYKLGHLARVDRIEARVREHPGLALAGNAYRGVGIPDAVRSGEAAAERVLHGPRT
jgi:oxygen-dependent protoporphyrinogen oxidase